MRIGELAEQAGTSTKAIRYYEQIGILTPPARTAAGYRTYDEAAMGRLSFVRAAQAVGLTLAEIRQIIAFRDDGPRTWTCASWSSSNSAASSNSWPSVPPHSTRHTARPSASATSSPDTPPAAAPKVHHAWAMGDCSTGIGDLSIRLGSGQASLGPGCHP